MSEETTEIDKSIEETIQLFYSCAYHHNDDENLVNLPVFKPVEHSNEFDPIEYLNAFYKEVRVSSSELAMKIVLFSLPNFVARIPDAPDIRVLDIGSGPTMYMAAYFRKKATEVYLSDFSELNINELKKWLYKDETAWDWSDLIQTLLIQEMSIDSVEKVAEDTRSVIKGVIHCNVFDKEVIDKPELGPFDVVTSVFCIEYASQDAEEYKRAINNLVGLVKPGGHLLYCGIQREGSYHFGGKRFMSHFLEEDEMFRNLEGAGIDMDTLAYCNHDGVFLVLGQRCEEIDNATDFEDLDD